MDKNIGGPPSVLPRVTKTKKFKTNLSGRTSAAESGRASPGGGSSFSRSDQFEGILKKRSLKSIGDISSELKKKRDETGKKNEPARPEAFRD